MGLTLGAGQLRQFEVYRSELLEWNTRFNLTAIKEPQAVETLHFVDSLSCLLAIALVEHRTVAELGVLPLRLVDLGSGAGFPGLPLAIACPNFTVFLVESIGKKARFLEHVAGGLELTNVRICAERAEDLARLAEHKGRYNYVLARAVSSLATLLEYAMPLLELNGHLIAHKKAGIEAELSAANRARRILGAGEPLCLPVTLPGIGDERQLIVYQKLCHTPAGFPRRTGLAASSPLS